MKQLLFFLMLTGPGLHAQELFPHNEPASNVPKNVIGVRVFGETYNEFGTRRNMGALRLMYGVTSKLSLMATGTVTNHHSDNLPQGLITHTHTAGGNSNFQTGTFTRGLQYPYSFNGVYFFGKYRFLTRDGQNRHFRMAVYGEYAYITAAHDETEPNLLEDTKGFGAGLIATYLKKHFAVSLTTGAIMPGGYTETTPDFFGGTLHTRINYGQAVKYNLSFGYLLFPLKYKSYKETSVSIYLEFMGKSYNKAKVVQNGNEIEPRTEGLRGGNYVDVHPGIQTVLNSNLRIDFSVGFPMIRKSFARFYPVYMLGIQRYFFL